MEKMKFYENYPFAKVILSNFVSFLIYLIGGFIIYQIGFIWLILYIIYILILEFKLIKWHCVNCHYYGKTCAFGKGRICKLFFRKGNPADFCKMKITWKNILPEFLVSLIPIFIGVYLLIKKFDIIILLLIILLFLLTSAGNGFVRGKLACRYCKQKELGCPAYKLFEKKNEK